MTQSGGRLARSDSIRNRAQILDAATRQITRHGPDVGMDEIARAAGLAVGTLYRHFPTKTDLISATVSAFVAEIADRAEAAAGHVYRGAPAFDVLAGLLRDLVQTAAGNQAVKAAAVALNADIGDSENVQRAHGALQTIIDAAMADDAVRGDLSIDDFYLLVTNAPTNEPPAVLEHWVDLILFGIAGPAPR